MAFARIIRPEAVVRGGAPNFLELAVEVDAPAKVADAPAKVADAPAIAAEATTMDAAAGRAPSKLSTRATGLGPATSDPALGATAPSDDGVSAALDDGASDGATATAQPDPMPAPAPSRKIDLGLDGSVALMLPREAPRPSGKSKAEIQRRLDASFAQDEVQHGLARGGVLVGSLSSAIRAEGPTRGEAVIRVTVDSQGRVGEIELVRGSANDWSRAQAAFRGRAGQKRVRVPKGARGLRITYAVRASVQRPSGSAVEGPAAGMKGPSLEPNGLVPQGGFDVADLAGGSQRMVYARVVSEEVL